MSESLLHTEDVKELLTRVSGLTNDAGDPRLKRIMHRLMTRPVPSHRGLRCST